MRPRHLTVLLCAAVALAGCGSDDDEKPAPSIPAASAQELAVYLNEAQRRFDSGVDKDNPGACEDIEEETFPNIERVLRGLPSSVDAEVRDTLESGLQRLRELVQDGCAGVEPTETETTPDTETTPTVTETVPPETETAPPPTTTTPPQTTPQQTTPQDPGLGGGGTGAPEEDED